MVVVEVADVALARGGSGRQGNARDEKEGAHGVRVVDIRRGLLWLRVRDIVMGDFLRFVILYF